jgi:hypothetical protein
LAHQVIRSFHWLSNSALATRVAFSSILFFASSMLFHHFFFFLSIDIDAAPRTTCPLHIDLEWRTQGNPPSFSCPSSSYLD